MELQELEIYCYKGSAYPSWMEHKEKCGPNDLKHLVLRRFGQRGPPPQLVDAFPCLRVFVLQFCSWDALPDKMKDLQSLEKLVMFACPNIESLPTLPRSLLSITVKSCNVMFMRSCNTPGSPNYQKVARIDEIC